MHNFTFLVALSFLTCTIATCGGASGGGASGGGGSGGGGSGGGAGNGPDLPDLTIDELAAKLLEIHCKNSAECYEYPSDADCQASVRYEVGQYKASIAAGRIIYHPEKAQACVDARGDADRCSVLSSFGPAGAKAGDACRAVYEPTVANGAACYADSECISANCETPPNCAEACCEGQCAAKAEMGESCAGGKPCALGLYCRSYMGFQTCYPTADEGQDCDAQNACTRPSFCALDISMMNGTCVRPAAHGEACNLDITFGCDRDDDYCSSMTVTCVSRRLIGESCDYNNCVLAARCPSGQCEARPSVGGACDPNSVGSQCLGDLRCEADGTCQLPAESVCP